jgi:deoxyribose-phosphate aldolase
MKLTLTPDQLAKYFDHTALKAETTASQIEFVCQEAKGLSTAAVCVNPIWLPLAVERLHGTPVLPITVVGFPLGASGTASKCEEARYAISKGAREVDMVLSVGELKSAFDDKVRLDIAAVKKVCGLAPLKVIFETSLLTPDEIRRVAKWCAEDGIDFVKTSTGFGSRGASLEDIKLMREAIAEVPGANTKIKASGGIRTLAQTLDLIAAGADRIGASATVSIVQELVGGSALAQVDY